MGRGKVPGLISREVSEVEPVPEPPVEEPSFGGNRAKAMEVKKKMIKRTNMEYLTNLLKFVLKMGFILVYY